MWECTLYRESRAAARRLAGRGVRAKLKWAFVGAILLSATIGCGRGPEPGPEPPSSAALRSMRRQFPGPASQPATDAEPPHASRLPVFELRIRPEDLSNLERSAFSNQTVPAVFTGDGTNYNVEVRYRGAWARTWPKKPLKIFFKDKDKFEGQHCLNLNSGWRDPALVRECLAYEIYRACGVPASQARLVRLNMNGRFWGVYVQVEQPDQAFLKRNNLKGASVYKANSHANQADERDLGSEAACLRHYEKQTRKQESARDLQEFLRDLAQAKAPSSFFQEHVDIDKYVNYLAATALTQNWDGFNKNHFLVYDGQGAHKWFVIPWDLDRTLGDHWDWSFTQAQLPPWLGTSGAPGITGWNRLQDCFFRDPLLRARLAERLAALLSNEFTPEKLFPILDKLEAEAGEDAVADRRRWPGANADIHTGIEGVKRFIEQRRAYLQSQLAALREAAPASRPGRPGRGSDRPL